MTGESVDTRMILEKAASSPDPMVRSAAIRYRQLERELAGYDSFFAFYGRAHEEAVAAAGKAKATTAEANGTVEDFIRRVCDVLVAHGRPMKVGHLFEVFFETYPDMTKTALDTFRQRLFKRRKRVQLIEGIGYWPADVPMPVSVSLPIRNSTPIGAEATLAA